MPKLTLPLSLLFLSVTAAAQSPAPRFPLPRDFVETPADLKAVSGNSALLKAIQLQFNCKKCDGAKEPGIRIGAAPTDLATRTRPKNEFAHRSTWSGTQFTRTGCNALYDRNDMGDVDITPANSSHLLSCHPEAQPKDLAGPKIQVQQTLIQGNSDQVQASQLRG